MVMAIAIKLSSRSQEIMTESVDDEVAVTMSSAVERCHTSFEEKSRIYGLTSSFNINSSSWSSTGIIDCCH